jgi:hypothetical protein
VGKIKTRSRSNDQAINIGLSLIIFLVSLLFVFSPLDRAEYIYTWQPSQQEKEVNLPIADFNIAKFSFSFPCELMRSESRDWVIEAFYGPAFQISLDANAVYVTLGHSRNPEVKTFKLDRIRDYSENCLEVLEFNSNSRVLSFNSSGVASTIRIPNVWAVEVSGVVKWNLDVPTGNSTFQVTSMPIADIYPPQIKKGLGLMMLALFFLYLIKFNFFSNIVVKSIKLKFSIIDLIVLIGIIFLGLFTIPDFDDGWYLLISNQLSTNGLYNNYATPNPRPTGFIYALMLSFFIDIQNSILGPRLLSLASIFLTWLSFKRIILPKISLQFSSMQVNLIALIFVGLISAFHFVLRPEPIISLLLAISIALTLKINSFNASKILFIQIIISGAALAIHPAGLVVPFYVFPLTAYMVWSNPGKSVPTIFAGSGFALTLLFLNANPWWLKEAARGYTAGVDPNSNEGTFVSEVIFYQEWLRVAHLLSEVSSPIQIFTGLLIAFTPVVFLPTIYFYLSSVGTFEKKLLVLSSLASYLGLFFLNIKWSMYYAVLLPVTLFLFIFSLKMYYEVDRRSKVYISSFILISTSLFFLKSLTFPFRCDFEICSFDMLYFENPSYFFYYNLKYLIALIAIVPLVVILYTTIKFGRKSTHKSILLIPASLIFLLLIPTIFLPLRDISYPERGWSLYRQNFYGAFSKDAYCGLGGKYFLKNEKELASLGEVNFDQFTIITMPNLYHAIPCSKPVEIKNGLWQNPEIGFGWVPIYSIGRLGNNSTFEVLGCSNIAREQNNSYEGNSFCFWRWSQIVQTSPEVSFSLKKY